MREQKQIFGTSMAPKKQVGKKAAGPATAKRTPKKTGPKLGLKVGPKKAVQREFCHLSLQTKVLSPRPYLERLRSGPSIIGLHQAEGNAFKEAEISGNTLHCTYC